MYWEADVWKDFGYTKEYDVTDVNKVDNHSETKEVSRYSLDGQRLASPTKGINIVRYGDGSIMAKTEHSHPLGMVVSTHFRCGKGVKRGLKNGALPFKID